MQRQADEWLTAERHARLLAQIEQRKPQIEKLIELQYEHLGYGKLRCRSCGSFAAADYETGKMTREECSKSCAFEGARSIKALLEQATVNS